MRGKYSPVGPAVIASLSSAAFALFVLAATPAAFAEEDYRARAAAAGSTQPAEADADASGGATAAEATATSSGSTAAETEADTPRAPAAPGARPSRSSSSSHSRRSARADSEVLELQDKAPLKYVVKKGDTLWDISAHFLQKPWLWPELWYNNPEIKNPHLIYPGDVLYLVWVNGRPRLTRTPPGSSGKLSPRIREVPLEEAIPTIPLDAIRAFLRGPRVVGEAELEAAPYVVDMAGEHLIAGSGDSVYVRNIAGDDTSDYNLVRRGEVYRDPDHDGEVIGYEAMYVGAGTVTKPGKTATFAVNNSTREVRAGDRLLPSDDADFSATFTPHAPSKDILGRIISVYDGVSQIGQFQICTINKGRRDGIEVGHVLSVWRAGRRTVDPVAGGRLVLPDEKAGLLMVFKTYDRLSYGLVMKATQAIHVLDKVKNPDAE